MSKDIHCDIILSSKGDDKTIGKMVKYTMANPSSATCID